MHNLICWFYGHNWKIISKKIIPFDWWDFEKTMVRKQTVITKQQCTICGEIE